ncbi:hypothetical protein [Rhodoligotrophos ferricapiens]|uniref:hypothetical protein n=1 Tax=Rhodoligotrophos ferricapiens TaxID=3069264 RepID=UPI00315DED9B
MSTVKQDDDPRWNWKEDAADPINELPGEPFSAGPARPDVKAARPSSTSAKPSGRPARGNFPTLNPRLIGIAAAAVIVIVGAGGYFLFSGDSSTGGGDAGPQQAITLQPSEKIVFSGIDSELKAAPANSITQQSAVRDNATVVIRSTTATARPAGTTGGAHLAIPASEVQALAGKRVRVTAWARGADPKPSARFAMAMTIGNGFSTGWIVFTPSRAFQPYSFDLVVPANAREGAVIGLWSDLDGRDGGIELRLVTLRPLS